MRVYVSTASSLSFDGEAVSGRDMRLARRILRDNKFRAHTLQRTVEMWESVCAGEDKHIAPYMGSADYIIDTLLPYEPFMMRDEMLELIADSGEYSHDPRMETLSRLYERCPQGDTALVPKESLLREFIGGGIYG